MEGSSVATALGAGYCHPFFHVLPIREGQATGKHAGDDGSLAFREGEGDDHFGCFDEGQGWEVRVEDVLIEREGVDAFGVDVRVEGGEEGE